MKYDSLAWLSLILLFVTWIYVKYRHYFETVILVMKLRGPPTVPFYRYLSFINDMEGWFQIANDMSKQMYGSISKTWVFFIPFVIVYKPEHLKIIMSSSKVSDKNFMYKFFEIFFCNGLITLTGDKWKFHRKLIQPFFSTKLMEKHYFGTFVKYSQDIISELGGQECLKIQNVTNKYVTKILHKTILGLNLESVEDTPFKRIENFGTEKLWKPWKILYNSDTELKQSSVLKAYVSKQFYERKKCQSNQTYCLLDKLIEKVESREFTEDEAINEAIMLLIAGHDSVAGTIITSLYHLAKNQNVQEKVYEEIRKLTSNNNIKVEHINQMYYLDCCIKETLRLIPTISIMARVLISNITLDNTKIPSGTNIIISPLVTHRLPEIFTDPSEYNPDRFSKENIDKLPSYSYIPFSMGPRNCIGNKPMTHSCGLLNRIRYFLSTQCSGIEYDSLTWLTLILLSLTWIFVKCRNYFGTVILVMKLRGPPSVPFYRYLSFMNDMEAWFQIANDMSKQIYGSISKTWICFIPFDIVYKPEHLKIIMSSSKLSDKNFMYKFFEIFFCNGLITLTGDKWKFHRKQINPFSSKKLIEKHYFGTFVKYSQDIISELGGQECLKIQNVTNKYVTKILHKTIFGLNLESVGDTPFKRIENFGTEKLWKPWKILYNSDTELKQSSVLKAYVSKQFCERKKCQSNQTYCLLDKLIEKVESREFTEDEAINEAIMLLIAGHDSVAGTIITSLYHLAKNQNVQEKVYEEIRKLTSNNNITVEHINQMYYLDCCIKETLRLIPTIPIMARVLISNITLDNTKIPSGTNIIISPLVTHRLPEIFTDPSEYNPDRFSKENIDKLPSYSYIPFSMGPRNCIGYKFAQLEIKTIIACILREYHIALREDTGDLSFVYRIALRIKGGVWFNIKPRKIIVK